MSDLSSPTGQKNLCKTYSTFFGEVARLGCPNLQYFAFPASASFLDFRSPISTVSIPFGMGRGVQGCPNLPYFVFPASASFSWFPQFHLPATRRRISGRRFSSEREKRQPEIRLRFASFRRLQSH